MQKLHSARAPSDLLAEGFLLSVNLTIKASDGEQHSDYAHVSPAVNRILEFPARGNGDMLRFVLDVYEVMGMRANDKPAFGILPNSCCQARASRSGAVAV